MKIGFISLGCPKNQLDAEVMLHELVMAGYQLTADETEADVVLYGHTHQAREDYIDGVYYVNPGSAGSYKPTAMLLSISDGGLLFSKMEL